MFESIKTLVIKTSMLFNLDFANNIILCVFLFFLFIDLYFLIPAVITQKFNAIAELVIPLEISTKETKAEVETHPVPLDGAHGLFTKKFQPQYVNKKSPTERRS